MVARPEDGNAVALSASAAVVWNALTEWCDEEELEELLGEVYPSTSRRERHDGLVDVLRTLHDEGLLERSAS